MEQSSRGHQSLAQGETERRAGRAEDARRAFGEAIAHFRAEGDLPGEAKSLTRQAQIARDTGNLDWALHDQIQAIALFRRIGDGAALAHALRHAGDMFAEQGRLAHATAHLHEALDLYRAGIEAPPLDFANALRSVALLAEALGERAEARRYWEEAREHYARLDSVFPGENEGVREAEAHLATLAG
ncbi:tetratricopeptide repeat protein [Sphingomonas sp. JC676]|uniref:tetratricopeptide repeat protein n=1 Tax=Sphingomonas sp. JC676 TaxID=2768065 RepID=UPI001657CC5D|nr:tetratricopeptide repeat protein [Sphingomonas sp. JC676]MBC9034172.1 tetratricopeptide repeat protein [Sphingomonas sp. JC676]